MNNHKCKGATFGDVILALFAYDGIKFLLQVIAWKLQNS